MGGDGFRLGSHCLVLCEELSWLLHTLHFPKLWGISLTCVADILRPRGGGGEILPQFLRHQQEGSARQPSGGAVASQLIPQISKGTLFHTILEIRQTNK